MDSQSWPSLKLPGRMPAGEQAIEARVLFLSLLRVSVRFESIGGIYAKRRLAASLPE